MNSKYKRFFQHDQEEGQFWPSFTDLLTTILLCFMLFFIIMMIIKSIQIKDMKKTLDQLMGVRTQLVEDLKDEFNDAQNGIEVDEKTGAIIFQTEILFDYNEAILHQDSHVVLDDFVPKYFQILLNSGYEDYIGEVIIEGHTDRDGSYLYNLELAQNRSLEVARYVLNDLSLNREMQKQIEEKLTVNSKSYADERTDQKGNYMADKSRRVEFKFRLKDEEILNKTREILGD